MKGCYVYFCMGCTRVRKQDLPKPPYPCSCGGKFRLMVQAVPQPGEKPTARGSGAPRS